MSVVEAVERDIALIRERDPVLADSTDAALALALAAEIDDPGNSATQKSMCAAQLGAAIVRLLDRSPPADEEEDALDGLQADHARRLRAVG